MQKRSQDANSLPQQAIRHHGVPETITIDGSEANVAAIKNSKKEHGTPIMSRQVKYLHNIVEQDHRAVKRITRPMLGFQSLEAAQSPCAGVELMHLLKQKQRVVEGEQGPHCG